MSASEREPQAIRFEFKDADDYKLIFATGAHGGVMPNGMVKFDLFVEFHTGPSAEQRSIGADGRFGEPRLEGLPTEAIHVTRLRQVGVMMTVPDARSLATWLEQKADESDKIRAATQKLEAGK
ncbi:MAG: hypothetical protein PHU43_04475 [Candidatus Bipolaricaulis sp.]|nr:hypothetical protein [Candidatus Bipolaricaulis sp.]